MRNVSRQLSLGHATTIASLPLQPLGFVLRSREGQGFEYIHEGVSVLLLLNRLLVLVRYPAYRTGQMSDFTTHHFAGRGGQIAQSYSLATQPHTLLEILVQCRRITMHTIRMMYLVRLPWETHTES